MAKFCQFEEIECFVPFQHERPNIYIWLCREKDALFTHILFVETGCTSKLLQDEMCQSSIDKMTQPITKNVSVVAMAFNIPVSCIYIYSCRNVLEVHRYFPDHVEQMLHLFCKLFLSRCRTVSLVIGAFF